MKPSFFKIIWSDYPALLATVFPIVLWILYLDAKTLNILQMILPRGNGATDPSVVLWVALIGTAIFLPILVFRIRSVYKHFADVDIVEGTVRTVNLFKDRGRIEYSYKYRGEDITAGNAIHINKFVKSLKIGEPIDLAVSRSDPGKALIVELYVPSHDDFDSLFE